MEYLECYKVNDTVYQIYKKEDIIIRVHHFIQGGLGNLYIYILNYNETIDQNIVKLDKQSIIKLENKEITEILNNCLHVNKDKRYPGISNFHIFLPVINGGQIDFDQNYLKIFEDYKFELKKVENLDCNITGMNEISNAVQAKYYINPNELQNEKTLYEKFLREHRLYNNNATDYIDWDTYFMGVAELSSKRSKDPNTKVGACIVDKNNRILSIGYNGAPNGYDDDSFPWNRNGDELETKYFYVVHAEANAIMNYRGSRKDLSESTVYVTLFPCHECTKLIIQSGIKNIVYLSDKYEGTKDNIAAKLMFDRCGVSYRMLDEEKKKVFTINLNKK